MSEDPSSNKKASFGAFEVWKEYQAIAMHFNDLLMRLRSQSLAAVAGLSAVAGVVVKAGVQPDLQWFALSISFLVLSLFWVAIWILDFRYYNRLLVGAVDSLIALEAQTKNSTQVDTIDLSTRIEQVVAEGRQPALAKLGRENARWWFYGIVFVTLVAGILGSGYASTLIEARPARIEAPAVATPVNGIAPSTAIAKPDDWERMRQCADQATRLADREGWGREPLTDQIRARDWNNHYSPKFGRCFVRINFVNREAAKNKDLPYYVYLLYDGFEGHGLATCTDANIQGASDFCSIEGAGDQQNSCSACRVFIRDRMSN